MAKEIFQIPNRQEITEGAHSLRVGSEIVWEKDLGQC